MVADFEELRDARVVDYVVYGKLVLVVFGNCFVIFRNYCVTISHEGVI
jgi:hypothetical protein